mgnify:CR=1 FL=1
MRFRPKILAVIIAAILCVAPHAWPPVIAQSSEEAARIVTDPKAPLTPVLFGDFHMSGPGVAYSSKFVHDLDSTGTCHSFTAKRKLGDPWGVESLRYERGNPSNYETDVYVGTKVLYSGPGIYNVDENVSDLEGGITLRDAAKRSIATVSTDYPSHWSLTTRADGSGSLTFSGPNRLTIKENGTGPIDSGTLSWICKEVHLKSIAALGSNPLPTTTSRPNGGHPATATRTGATPRSRARTRPHTPILSLIHI